MTNPTGRTTQTHLFVELELGRTLAAEVEEAGKKISDEPSAYAQVFQSAMRHLPLLTGALSQGGVVLARGEVKKFRTPRRRKIPASTWSQLAHAARQLDMTRPQLLRALLRLELGLHRTFDSASMK